MKSQVNSRKKNQTLRKKAERCIWLEAMREVKSLTIGGLAMIVSSYSNQVLPRLMGDLMDPASMHTKPNNHQPLTNILVLSLIGGAASFIRTLMLNQAKDSIAARLRKEAFQKLLDERELEWFHMEDNTKISGKEEQGEAGDKDMVSKAVALSSVGMTPAAIGVIMKDDVEVVANTATSTVANLLRSTSSCVFGTYHMLCINPSLVGLSLAVAPIVGTLSWLTRKYLREVLTAQQAVALNAASFLDERLTNVSLIKVSNREKDEMETYSKIQEKYVELGWKSAFANGLSMGSMFFLSTTALCGILLAGGKAVEAKRMKQGQLVSFGSYSFMLALGSAGIVRALGDYSKAIQSGVRLFHLMDRIDDENESNRSDATSETTKIDFLDVSNVERVTVENVFFSYKGDSSTDVLRNLSLAVSRGQVVAITGKNGSGKSTLASLLAGLYSPTAGNILVHSKSSANSTQVAALDYTSEIPRQKKAKLIQVVPQLPAFFNATIAENVRYSHPGASVEDVEAAMSAANCDKFVSKLEGGLQYQVGRNGSRLSGGQRQRLALARALLVDPVCLVLDEPASALDAEGETAVMDAIEACRASHRALLVITHRINTLQLADHVVVLKEGTVVEEGPLHVLQQDKGGDLCTLMPDLI